MRFTLVRHAQPEWLRDGLNVDNPTLTALGRTQADQLGERFRGTAVDHLLVSTMRRAHETAEPIAAALGVEPEPCEWLPEIGTPVWEGTPAEHVVEIFRNQRARPVDELWDGLEGGETFHDFHRRVTHGLQEFMDRNKAERVHDHPALWRMAEPDRHVVIVAHGGTNAVVIGYLLGIQPVPWEWERFVSYHASASTLQPMDVSGRHAYSLARFSDVAHLEPELHTR